MKKLSQAILRHLRATKNSSKTSLTFTGSCHLLRRKLTTTGTGVEREPRGGGSRTSRRREAAIFEVVSSAWVSIGKRAAPRSNASAFLLVHVRRDVCIAFFSSLVSHPACTEKRDGPLRAWCAAKVKKKKNEKKREKRNEREKEETKGKEGRGESEEEGPSTSLEDICAESGMSSRLTGDHPGQNESCMVHERRQASFSSRSFLALAISSLSRLIVRQKCAGPSAGLTTSVRVFGRSRFRANGSFIRSRPLSSYTLWLAASSTASFLRGNYRGHQDGHPSPFPFYVGVRFW